MSYTSTLVLRARSLNDKKSKAYEEDKYIHNINILKDMVSDTKRSMLILALIGNVAGVFLLLTEDFGAWQDRDPFYGVSEGYVWLGSEKAFPWAQITILTLTILHAFSAYVVFQRYSRGDSVSLDMAKRGYQSSLVGTILTVVFGVLFVVMVMDSDWWWFGGGFYGSLIGGGIATYILRLKLT